MHIMQQALQESTCTQCLCQDALHGRSLALALRCGVFCNKMVACPPYNARTLIFGVFPRRIPPSCICPTHGTSHKKAMFNCRWPAKDSYGDPVEKRTVITPDRRYDPDLVLPEWSQWLKMTRQEPPSEGEIAGCLPLASCLL